MSNPTSNFNWQMPTATDLVTDLPADFEVFGQAVDTSLADLKGGTSGQVLTKASGTDMDFTWATPAGGKVLQVVFGSTSTGASSNSTTFATTNLTATITPSSATSKVLVLVNQNGCVKSLNNISMYLRLMRGASTLANLERNGGNTNSSATNGIGSISASYLDTPATTSATTYLTEFAASSASNAVTVQDSLGGANALSTIILMEIGA